MIEVRPARTDDLPRIAEIQSASPEAAQWNLADHLGYDCRVALLDGRLAGFAVARALAPGESELLNLAVDPALRKLGIARRLMSDVISRHPGELWLEVRESNQNARKFYKKIGFQEIARRPDYYPDSHEGAIVMKFHSW